jgi:3-oxoacyl-[acyl-carrier protein] reductase
VSPVALVTGAGSPDGIGFATAKALGRDGMTVAIASTTGRITERAGELGSMGYKAVGFVADLTDDDQARRMVSDVARELGPVLVLVNNAGMVQVGSGGDDDAPSFMELDHASWQRSIARNLSSAFSVTQAVLPGMIEEGYGRIVMVSSVTGSLVSNPGSAAYSAAKAGMDGLMRALALETARKGITVNSVAPGWVATGSQTKTEVVAGRHTPIGRSGTPEEVAELIAFLCSERSSYITGGSIAIDGGNTIQEYKGPPEGWY